DAALPPTPHHEAPGLQPRGSPQGTLPMRTRLLMALVIFPAWVGLTAAQAPPADLKGHNEKVYSVAFSPDGKALASAAFDGNVKLWDWPAGKEQRTIPAHPSKQVYCVAFAPDSKTLATSSDDQSIRLWNVADGKMIREIKGHTGIVDSIAFSADGKTL